MSKTLLMTVQDDPQWAADEIAELRAKLAASGPGERALVAQQIILGVPFEREDFPANAMHREAAAVIAKWLSRTALAQSRGKDPK